MRKNLPAANLINFNMEIRVSEFLPYLSGEAGDHSLPPAAGDHSPLSTLSAPASPEPRPLSFRTDVT